MCLRGKGAGWKRLAASAAAFRPLESADPVFRRNEPAFRRDGQHGVDVEKIQLGGVCDAHGCFGSDQEFGIELCQCFHRKRSKLSVRLNSTDLSLARPHQCGVGLLTSWALIALTRQNLEAFAIKLVMEDAPPPTPARLYWLAGAKPLLHKLRVSGALEVNGLPEDRVGIRKPLREVIGPDLAQHLVILHWLPQLPCQEVSVVLCALDLESWPGPWGMHHTRLYGPGSIGDDAVRLH
mmetsp:Transcript_64107/g.139459  ORF Transcript_64107/g.139459 Transcript_64107/m.139459 type:complete len:237 (-) Transcript_64107:344-1054(-)